MTKICIICSGNGTYKCPTCFIYYCSSKCCKKHRENQCELVQKEESISENAEKSQETFRTPEEISSERLKLLKSSDEVKNFLANPHLRDLLVTIDQAENAEQIMQKAMLEPLFVEFADACIKAVEPQNDGQDENQDHT